MALSFPADITTQNAVSRGSGKLYYAVATVNGADATPLTDLGPTSAGIEIDHKRTLHDIICDQFLGRIGVFPAGETFEVKTTMMHDNLAQHYGAWGTLGVESNPANVLTGGTVAAPAGTLTFGESSGRRYCQLVWRGPGPGDTVTRTTQLWRATPMPGNVKFEKAKERTMAVAWTVSTDPGAQVAGRGAVGLSIDA